MRAQDSRKQLFHAVEIADDERDMAQAEYHAPTLRPAHDRLKRSGHSRREQHGLDRAQIKFRLTATRARKTRARILREVILGSVR